MAQNNRRSSDGTPPAAVEFETSDGYIVATDTETGVTSQGENKAEALSNLAEALRLHQRPIPDEVDKPEEATAPWF
jgi:predicted RNase H-like HicB family nuclease